MIRIKFEEDKTVHITQFTMINYKQDAAELDDMYEVTAGREVLRLETRRMLKNTGVATLVATISEYDNCFIRLTPVGRLMVVLFPLFIKNPTIVKTFLKEYDLPTIFELVMVTYLNPSQYEVMVDDTFEVFMKSVTDIVSLYGG